MIVMLLVFVSLSYVSFSKPLEIVFKSRINQGIIPVEWKKKIMSHQCIKQEIINILKTADRFLFFQILAKHLKEPLITTC